MHETSGVLRPAVETYLRGEAMTGEQIAAMRAYLRQWIMAPVWKGPEIEELRGDIDTLTSRATLEYWLDRAGDIAIDPL